MGTTLWVEGRGVRVCETTGGLIRGLAVDEYVETHDEAIRLGRKEVKVWPLAIMPRDYVMK